MRFFFNIMSSHQVMLYEVCRWLKRYAWVLGSQAFENTLEYILDLMEPKPILWNCTPFRHSTDEQLQHRYIFFPTNIICSLSTLNWYFLSHSGKICVKVTDHRHYESCFVEEWRFPVGWLVWVKGKLITWTSYWRTRSTNETLQDTNGFFRGHHHEKGSDQQ